MGFNTTVVIHNDAFSEIENNPQWGSTLLAAIQSNHRTKQPTYFNGGVVVESHHADMEVTVKVGHNTGEVIK